VPIGETGGNFPSRKVKTRSLKTEGCGTPRAPALPANKERRGLRSPRLPSFSCSAYFLHPEQEAQQSADEQHDAFAAFTAPAKPSAITATNRIALILFMFFLLFR